MFRSASRFVRFVRFGLAGGVALVVLVSVAGCGNDGRPARISGTGAVVAGAPTATATARPAADGVQQVVIDTTDADSFSPNVVIAHPGELRITVTNPSAFPTDLAIPSLGVHSATIFSGRSTVVSVDIPAGGDYQFVCTFHEHEGMTGTLVVSPPASS